MKGLELTVLNNDLFRQANINGMISALKGIMQDKESKFKYLMLQQDILERIA
jgi:hypothetical protein